MTHDLTCKVLDHPGRMCSDITPDDRINLLPHTHTPIDVCRHGRSIIQVCDQCVALSDAPLADPINHPPHYTQHPSGVECITITEHYNFNVGNAIKYLWRAGLKDGADAADDLRKAAWYVQREIDRPIQPTEATVYCGLCNVVTYIAILP